MKAGPLCILACQWCNLPEFWEWAGVVDAAGAKQFILKKCGVDSRKQLDDNYVLARGFCREIRLPFMAWREKRALK